jgi:dihydrofolate reductase
VALVVAVDGYMGLFHDLKWHQLTTFHIKRSLKYFSVLSNAGRCCRWTHCAISGSLNSAS